MTLRKIATLLLGAGLTFGILGAGISASFSDSLSATENIQVGTLGCTISHATAGIIAAGGHSVTYDVPKITSSAASSAPFTFTVKATGDIPVNLHLSQTTPSAPFTSLLGAVADVTLAPDATHDYAAGLQWPELGLSNMGQHASITYTVACSEVAAANVIFDDTSAALPSNLSSFGPEAYAFNEFGSAVTFAGTARHLASATVTMSNWACQSGSWNAGDCVTTPGATYNVPITFNVYAAPDPYVPYANAVGALIATKTQTFAIPFRPSGDATHCPADPTYYAPNAVKWFDGTACYNGIAHNITFTFAGETVPNNAAFGIAYNTSTQGYTHLGASSPADALNIGVVTTTTPSVGALLIGAVGATYDAEGAVAFHGPFNGQFNFYTPAVQITAN